MKHLNQSHLQNKTFAKKQRAKQTIVTMIKENFSDSREHHNYKVLKFSAFKIQIYLKKYQIVSDWTKKCWSLDEIHKI